MDENPYELSKRFEAMTSDASPSPGLHARIRAAGAGGTGFDADPYRSMADRLRR